MHSLEKLLRKKHSEGKILDKSSAKAKSSILENLANDMMDLDGDKVSNLKKVTIASDSPKGLEKGLDKAKEMIGQQEEMEEESPEHEASESEEEELSEHEEPQTPEEIEAKIAELKAKLAELKA